MCCDCVAVASCSSRLSSRRPSPSAMLMMRVFAASPTMLLAKPAAASARSNSAANAASSSAFSTYTVARESSALFNSNEGFSVVAPINVTSPDSTCGKNASCWLLLNRCTSSTNKMVLRCRLARLICARSMASRISFTPDNTADSAIKSASNTSAIKRASVVLPTPGGPHKIIECGRPASKAIFSGMPSPVRCACPITSASTRGRRRSARGTSSAVADGNADENKSVTFAIAKNNESRLLTSIFRQ